MANTLNDRKTFIDELRNVATALSLAVDEDGAALRKDWDAGYSTWISDITDFEGIEGIEKADVTALFVTLDALNTLFGQGHRTNILKMKK